MEFPSSELCCYLLVTVRKASAALLGGCVVHCCTAGRLCGVLSLSSPPHILSCSSTQSLREMCHCASRESLFLIRVIGSLLSVSLAHIIRCT